LKQFSGFIGMNDKSLHHLFVGRREPTEEQAQLLAYVFNDVRFCEAVGIELRDRRIIYLQKEWDTLDETAKTKISEIAERYKAK
jgi:hypothetical protein